MRAVIVAMVVCSILAVNGCGRNENSGGDEAGLLGRAVKESDVESEPSVSWEGGTLIAVPIESVDELWRNPQTGDIDPPFEVSRAQRSVDLEIVHEFGASAAIGRGGSFALAVPDGAYLVYDVDLMKAGVTVPRCTEKPTVEHPFDASTLWSFLA